MTSECDTPNKAALRQHWQRWVLDAACGGALLAAAAGAILRVMTSGPRAGDDQTVFVWSGVAAAFCLLAALGLRRVSSALRSWLCLTGLFLLGVFTLASTGLEGSGRIWLLAAPLVGVLLLGLREALLALFCATAALVAILCNTGPGSFLDSVVSGLARHWLVESVIFAGSATTLTLCLWLVRNTMERALLYQVKDHEALGRERAKLDQANKNLLRGIEERREVEARLLQSSQRLAGIVQHAREIIYTLSAEGRIDFVSPAVSTVLGYAPEEVLGRHFAAFVHPEDETACQAFFLAVLQGCETHKDIGFRALHKNGAWRWCTSTGGLLPRKGEGAEIRPAFVGIVQDVTETKTAMAKLADSEKMYRLLAENSADVIFTTDRDLHITYVSPAVERLTGYTPAEVMRTPVYGLLTSKQAVQVQEALRCRLSDEARNLRSDEARIMQLEVEHKDGRRIWTETVATPLRDDTGGFEGMLGVIRDITSRKQVEQALEQAHQDMQALVGAITAVLVLLDADYRVKRWNMSAEKAFSLPAEAVLGHKLFELPLDWDAEIVRQAVLACSEDASHIRLDEIRYAREGAGDGLLGLTCNPVPGGGVLLLARDITEAVSRQLRQAHEQKMQSLGNLAAGVAHEINTPIQYLGYNVGFLEEAFGDLLTLARSCRELRQVLEQGGVPSPSLLEKAASCESDCDLQYLLDEVPRALANSRRGIEQIGGIVQAMKQLAHPGRLVSKARGQVDCNSIVTNAVTVTRNEWKHHSEVVLELEHNLPRVSGWAPELGQVLVNLLLNAAHANEEARPKGSRRKGRIICRTRSTDGWVEITVSDTGPGIPEEIQAKIFDPFFTTKEVGKGTGQGLAIAHAIVVEQHKGEIGFAPGESGGAVFTLRLPLE